MRLQDIAVPTYVQMLGALSAWLDKAEAQLPDGEKHHDEYLGDVETYHHGIDAQIPYTVAAGTARLTLSVQYQGCHEVDPKICYPPHTEKLDLALPAAAGGAATSGQDFGTALRTIDAGGALGANSAALPAEQAFRVEALATAPDRLLLRWTMAKGYYLYRDQTALSVPGAPALKLVPDLTLEKIESSCCGMAGAFGYQAETVAMSLKMGEAALLPAARAADADTVLVADGTSCRHQIADGAQREAVHVATFLARHLG